MQLKPFGRGAMTVVFLATAIAGCGEDNHARPIGFGDVTGLPTGNATGALFSGRYIVTTNVLEACHCRAGSCLTLMGIPGATLQVQETDGTIEFVGPTGSINACRGGVDQDAKFWCGAFVEELGNVQYALVKGRFGVSGGQPASISGTQEVTGATMGLDCDIRTKFGGRFVGPLAAASSSLNGAAPAVPTVDLGIASLEIRSD